jgi:DNA adenine methylase
VVIERLPYAQLIERYDRPGTLFYLDPPYWGCEDYYGDGMFSPADFTALAGILRSLKGHFILSLNDLPEVRQTFSGFHLTEVQPTYFAAPARNNRAAELLISNTQ